MDYKYIEQLLERYWNCETSIEEEQILRTFFRQKEIPAHLLRYQPLFAYQEKEHEVGLGNDFDERVLAKIGATTVKATRLTLKARLMPLFKAAAMLVMLFTIAGTMKYAISEKKGNEIIYVYDQFGRSAADPQVAYEADSVKSPLKEVAGPSPLTEDHKQ